MTQPARRPGSRRRIARRDRIVAAGLAGAAGVGLLGLVAARAGGAGAPLAEPEGAPAISPEGLEDYARQLTQEQARLAWYRAELRSIAEQLAQGQVPDTEVAEWVSEASDGPLSDVGLGLAPDAATYSS